MDEELVELPAANRLSDLYVAMVNGDPFAVAAEARKATEVPVSDGVMMMVAWAAVIWAAAGFMRRTLPGIQPYLDIGAEALRRGLKLPPKDDGKA
jgi:hypothetical protein